MRAADVIVNLELNDILTFGKHKGKKVEDIYKDDSGYLVWLREERRTKNDQSNFFCHEVNVLLDMTIRESKSLRKKYMTWDALGLYTQAEAANMPAPMPAEPEPEREVAYGGWGAF